MPRIGLLTCCAALLVPPLAAQHPAAPVRFGVSYTGGSATGAFGRVAEDPRGFTAHLALPISRGALVGLRAEFQVLTFPERGLIIGPDGETGAVEVSARGTIGFTGAGPRLEVRRGPLAIGIGAMLGFIRVITDATARADFDGQRASASVTESDYAFAGKGSLDGHLALYRGVGGTAVGVVAGADWSTAGRVAFPALATLRMSGPGTVTLQRPDVRPRLTTIRVGVGVEF